MYRKTFVFVVTASLILSVAAAVPPQATGTPYEALKREAERYYAEKSFSRAHQLYQDAAKLELPVDDRRWVRMRLADTAWRADRDGREEARRELELIAADTIHDLAWAEANESLGDYHYHERRGRDFYTGLRYYLAALDYWAGSDQIEVARGRYLSIVRRLTEQQYMATAIPREVLLNAITIAQTDEDRARFRFHLATQLRSEGRPESIERAIEHLEAIIALGRKTEWYDDALYAAAELLSQTGRMEVTSSGEVEYHPDFARALEYYRRIVSELTASETQFHDEATQAIKTITNPQVGVAASGTFLPDSEQEIVVSWRNVNAVALAIHAVDLTTDPDVKPNREWTQDIRLAGRTPLRRWTFTAPDRGRYRPGTERLRLEPRLAPGAYMVTADGASDSARQLLLVTDAHILVHTAGQRMQVFVSSVLTGEPIPNAKVAIWQQADKVMNKHTLETDAKGLAFFEGQGTGNVHITAAAGASRQAWHATYRYWNRHVQAAQWRIYAFTDRPAYRPNETVQWKIIARIRERGRWITPANQSLLYEISSPRGEKVAEGTATLNAFGSFWAELPLTPAMALGAYTISFRPTTQKDGAVGHAQLFRLEEYKLPEFHVRVTTPEGRQYRLGDTIEAEIQAEYYFGGPVANATVEAVIYQQPFVRPWYPWRKYPWYFQDSQYWGGEQTILRRETLTTDANGRATVRIETSRDARDSTYRIEARVVDASRREVRGEGTVRVTRQRYSVLMHPEHTIHRPGEQVSVDIKAMDANDRPVQTTGTVTVLRRSMQRDVFETSDEEVMSTKVSTDAEGEATFTFTAKTTGYYIIRWRSEDNDPDRPTRARDIVVAETAVWVTDRRTADISYRTAGLDLVVDKESFREGERVSAIVVTPASGRWVMISASATDLIETQVVHLDGTVKLVEFTTDERHSPNFFLTASSIFDRNIATDTERVVVPPIKHFIDVGVTSNREDYQPRDEAELTITTRDVDGKPVAAEVAVAVSDESVTAIQQDPAGDPRQFFFGEVLGQTLQVSAALHSQRYVKLIIRDGRVVDADAVAQEERDVRRRDGRVGAKVGAVAESVATDAAAGSAAAPPPAPVPASLAAQAIAVTAPGPQNVKEEGQQNQVQVEVRSDFRSTAFWKPDVVTGADGRATIKVKFPEALTTWRTTARAVTIGTQVGMGSDTARTNLPLIVRLQAPRFFVVGDKATVSAVINNNTDEPMSVTPSIEVKGLTLADAARPAITVPPHAEGRADWIVSAGVAGPATLRVTGRATAHGDAMEKSFIVYEHGIDKLVARSGKLRAAEALVRLDLPKARRGTQLVVNVTPTLANTMIDALPYVIEFPYGCTEQTMSRFLPAAVVAKTGLATGITNLDAVTAQGMARLYDMQHADGGWGWWKEGPTDDFMTAYVVWGFSIARDAGLPVRPQAVDRAAAYLQRRLAERDRQWNDLTWMLHALSAWRKAGSDAERRAFEKVWTNREHLTAYSRALLALTAHRYGSVERAKTLIRNLEDGVKVDNRPDQSVLIRGEGSTAETMATAHWGASGFWWRWQEGPIETTAFALQAMVTIQPDHRLIEPAMNWLVKNRRGAQWTNTRDTAIAVLALNDYLKVTGELRGDVTWEVAVNGQVLGTGSNTQKFAVDAALLRDTMQEIRIRRTAGTGAVYFAAEARFVSLEEPVKAAGNELFVRRDYYRLAPKPTLLKGVQYDKVPLRDGESIKSGERVEVVISIEPKNDYSYLVFEDLKPAGLEAVALQSGESLRASEKKGGRTAFVYQELRDRKVALFVDHLPQGIWEIRYTLRAEVPGAFHALPVLGWAMYVPDIRANGDEVRMEVRD